MKKLIIGASALAMATTATPAFAESSDTLTVNMTGNVEQICTAVPKSGFGNGGNAPGIDNPNEQISDDNMNLTFDFEVDNSDDPTQANIGMITEVEAPVKFTMFCNDDFTVTATPTNNAFINSATAPAGFTNTFAYNLSLRMNSLSSSGPAGVKEVNSAAYQGEAKITFRIDSGTEPPVAGDYQETVTVRFAADS